MPHLLSVADHKKLAYRPPLMDIGALRHDHSLQALWGVLYGAASTWGEPCHGMFASFDVLDLVVFSTWSFFIVVGGISFDVKPTRADPYKVPIGAALMVGHPRSIHPRTSYFYRQDCS